MRMTPRLFALSGTAGWISGLLWLVILTSCSPGTVLAAPARNPAPEGWRFLLVVETSRAMSDRQDAAYKLLHELISSGMRGEALPGDSLGIWTFDAEFHTGQFPLQRWAKSNATEIAAVAIGFLRSQTNENVGRIERALDPICQLATRSEGLTVILVTTGQPVRGTPFDEQINTVTGRWKAYQDEKNLPFVTVLRVQKGEFADFTVTPLPWPLSWPWPPRAIAKAGAGPDPKSLDSPRVVQSPKAATAPLILNEKKPVSKTSVAVDEGFEQLVSATPPSPITSAPQPDRTVPDSATASTHLSHAAAEANEPSNPQTIKPISSGPPLSTALPRDTNTFDGSSSLSKDSDPISPKHTVAAAPNIAGSVSGAGTPTMAARSQQTSAPPTPSASQPGEGTSRDPASGGLVPAANLASPVLPTAAEAAPSRETMGAAADPASDRAGTEPRRGNRFLRVLAACIGLSALVALIWLSRGFRRPHRASIITQSLERQQGSAASPRLYEHVVPPTPPTPAAKPTGQPR